MTDMYVQPGTQPAMQPGTRPTDEQSPVAATMDAVADQAGDLKHQAGEEVGTVVEAAKSEAIDLADEARRRVRQEADAMSDRAASMFKDTADELTSMAASAENPGPAAQIVRQVGERVDTAAERLRREGYQGIARDVSNWARQNPGLFLFAAAGTGFVLGRVFRSVDAKGVAEVVRGTGSASSSETAQLEAPPYQAPSFDAPGFHAPTSESPTFESMTPPAPSVPPVPPAGGPAQYPGA